MHSLVVDADFVMSVAFSPDGRLLASGENSVPALGLYRGKDGTLSLYMTDKRLRSLSSSARIRLWDPHAGRQIRTLTSYTGQVTSLAFSPDGKTLAGGRRLWDVATGQEIENSHTGFVHSVAFSPDGHLLASGDYDKKVRIWDLNPPRK
jgi:WD40 repeat protein